MKSSRVEDIFIPLNKYKRTYGSDELFPYFVGRKKIIKKLTDLISTEGENGGSYLMVGARGMGKTTIINKVISNLNKNKKGKWLLRWYFYFPRIFSIYQDRKRRKEDKVKGKFEKREPGNKRVPILYEKIEISLSNENFEDIDFYRIIGRKLFGKFLFTTQPTYWIELIRGFFMLLLLTSLIQIFIASGLHKKTELMWLLIPGATFLFGAYIWLLLKSFGWKKLRLRQRAKYLLRRIEADISKEASVSFSSKIGNNLPGSFLQGSIGNKQIEKYPIADIRFIEHELIEFIRQVNELYQYTRFVFVFDELDKIEADGGEGHTINYEMESEAEEVESRKKQKAVFEILGNFKYFLKNAHAKFIFIAGREMTDASMADISKRNFYLRSIFDEILHISSLLKEDVKNMDLRITSAVELYVYGMILGEPEFLEGNDAVMTRRKKIWKVAPNDPPEKQLLEDQVIDYIFKTKKKPNKALKDESIQKQRYREFLQDFILYITYRSHGAPKLLTQYIERYIEDTGKGFQLRFIYNDLVVIGYVSNMYRQLIKATYNTTIGNSDKLLSTLPFLVDHFLKFHDFAFSWRSLELLPDVIDVNKSPNLRRHIKNILDYLKVHQVNEISNGLFQYKFTKTSSNEIRYIGSISRTSRAAFNFTLDESYPLKKAFGKRIQRLLQTNPNASTHRDMIHSIEFYHTVLGDLHFYDKEYDQAIEHYNNAVQPFRSKNIHLNEKGERIRSHEFIMYVRGMLKLVLTYERIRDYHLIFTYLERVNRNSFDYFHFNDLKIDMLSLDFDVENDDNSEASKEKSQSSTNSRKIFELEDYVRSSDFQFNNQWIFVDGLLDILYVLEKASPQGVTLADIERSVHRFHNIVVELGGGNEIEYVRRGDWTGKKWWFAMLEAHFSNHIGDLLFFKNGYLPGTKADGGLNYDGDQAIYFYEHIFKSFVKPNDPSPDFKKIPRYYNLPYSAYQYYRDSLANMLLNSESLSEEDWPGKKEPRVNREIVLLGRYYEFAHSENKLFRHNYQSKLFYLVGGYIADFADLLLCLSVKANADNQPIVNFLEELRAIKGNKVRIDSTSDMDLNAIMNKVMIKKDFEVNPAFRFTLFTFLSGIFFRKINRTKEYTYSLLKIIYLLKYNCSINNHNNQNRSCLGDPALQDVYSFLFLPAFHELSRGVDDLVDLGRTTELRKFLQSKDLSKALSHPSIRELFLALAELILESGETNTMGQYLVDNQWVHSFSTVNDSWIRTLELRYKVELNRFQKKQAPTNQLDFHFDVDSIWCLKKIITNLEVYGISYITNHYFRAEAHHKLADFLAGLLNNVDDEINEQIKEDIKGRLYGEYRISMSTKKLDEFLNPMVHYRYAKDHYLMTIKLHSQGSCYYDVIENMFYLEGDFDDQYTHFCAAMDRYRINTEWVGSQLDKCRAALTENVNP